ncbi:MAG: GntR family transcriptional regulator [Chloroflexi bacterium]|nr:GntR family transcriptional regulator [Ardenticatenaceae bacterium]MBL1127919.1 GntR family transcriptional regulator [Chloroflexota bacterium]NOG33989.1 GntR family transcriptional regulator [Chloroflexota bacterium]GIK55675.1 MAG: HTH-type transcriptional repressor YvoA [Chloroflexota bacterium]
MLNVDRNSPLPLHYQLKQYLLEQIESGVWQPNDLIPSEQELQTLFGVSRITVRQALRDLVYEGLLIRERGRGTFVAPPKMTHSPADHRSLTEFMLDKAIKPGWQVLNQEFVEASREVASALALPHRARVYRIHRLRLANDEPIGQHTAYLPEEVAFLIDQSALREGGSLNYINHLPQMASSRATRVIEAVAASDLDTRWLHLSLGSPILQITRTIWSMQGEAIEFLQARYRGDRFKYQIGE